MKIAIYNDWWSPEVVGGAEKTALELSTHLASVFGTSNIAVYTLSNSNVTIREIQDNLRVTRLRSRTFRSKYSVGTLMKILEKIRIILGVTTRNEVITEILTFEPDLVILHNVDRLGMNFASYFKKISSVPIIRVQHDLGDTCINRTRSRRISKKNCIQTCTTCKIKEFHFRSQSKHYAEMISVSEFLQSTFHRLKFAALVSTYGYPSKIKSSFTSNHLYFDDKFGLRLGFVGRVVPEKGIEIVLHSMAVLTKTHGKKVSLTVCGAGSDRYLNKLRNLARKLDVELILLGHCNSPFDILAGRIDAVVVPSIWQEPLGRVPMEALSHGLPCFVSRIGGLSESKLFLRGPIVYFEPSNYIDLTEKLLFSLDNGISIFESVSNDRDLNLITETACRTLQKNRK
jgi:glycosyltransferase involved in cell wall biosynthesis